MCFMPELRDILTKPQTAKILGALRRPVNNVFGTGQRMADCKSGSGARLEIALIHPRREAAGVLKRRKTDQKRRNSRPAQRAGLQKAKNGRPGR